ncbi:MAG: 2-dehydropantoate 2-reductase [Rhodospirillaceae bacterium]|nr:2-dehydropantoate 2-reductase [Rhodospirillaceae bacterium]
MKICIFGAGAIGGYVAVKLAQTGQQVSVVARGAHLDAIKAKGLTLKQGGMRYHARPKASADAADLGPQDYVFLSVKAPALPDVAAKLAPLIGPETAVITAMNGIPWWFFHGFGAFHGTRFESIDPAGALSKALPPERVVGCVLHIACSVPEPGMIVHNNQNRFFLGELDGSTSPRLAAIVEAMKAAGMEAEARPDIRRDVWVKLLGNLTYAPVSVLTGATNDAMAADPGVRKVFVGMIEEANAVGAHYGLASDMSTDARIDLGGSLVGFRTSMLQDLDKGRPVELDTIVRAVIDMGRKAGVATPVIDTVYALAAQRARAAGLYKPWGEA